MSAKEKNERILIRSKSHKWSRLADLGARRVYGGGLEFCNLAVQPTKSRPGASQARVGRGSTPTRPEMELLTLLPTSSCRTNRRNLHEAFNPRKASSELVLLNLEIQSTDTSRFSAESGPVRISHVGHDSLKAFLRIQDENEDNCSTSCKSSDAGIVSAFGLRI